MAVLVSGALQAARARRTTPRARRRAPPRRPLRPSGRVGAALLAAYYDRQVGRAGGGGAFQGASYVPLDYAKPSGETIEVSVIRLRTGDQDKKIGSLILNPGGPGGSGVDYARAARAVVDEAVRARYDVVGLTRPACRRRAHASTYSTMPSLLPADRPTTPPRWPRWRSCRSSSPRPAPTPRFGQGLRAHRHRERRARHTDVLRAALGDEKLSPAGRVVRHVQSGRRTPTCSRPGRAHADGAIDPTLTNVELTHGQAKSFGSALRRFVEDCITQRPLPRGTALQGPRPHPAVLRRSANAAGHWRQEAPADPVARAERGALLPSLPAVRLQRRYGLSFRVRRRLGAALDARRAPAAQRGRPVRRQLQRRAVRRANTAPRSRRCRDGVEGGAGVRRLGQPAVPVLGAEATGKPT